MTSLSKKIELFGDKSREPATQEVSRKPQHHPQTERLVLRCLDGETAAYAALYQLYAPYIYRLIFSLLQHKEDAEEVLQDSFEYAFRKLHQFDPSKSQFKTWLYRIAVSRTRNKRRRKILPTFSIQQYENADHNEPFDIVDENEIDPETSAEKLNNRKIIWSALGELSDKLRETVILRHYEGLTYQEIGGILNIPPKTVESRMRLAHKALREILREDL